MLTPEEALQQILTHTPILLPETVPLEQAEGRVLAEELFAQSELPPFDNSAMDGFAVRSADVADAGPDRPVKLKMLDVVRAGSLPRLALQPGQAIKIMTGAPIPKGADAVVMKEFTSSTEDDWITIFRAPKKNENIRPKGEDIRVGQSLALSGLRVRPYDVALLAAQGFKMLSVVRKPKVAVLATGDELVSLTEPLAPGKIRNSNGPAIAAFLSRWKVPCRDLGIAGDDPARLEEMLRDAFAFADVLLVSGGVSVGDFDYTKAVLEKSGVREIFWKAAIKPGKPIFYGLKADEGGGKKIVFGLPGNPVSALVCLEEFVRPALEKLQGFTPKHPSYHLQGKAVNAYPKPKDRQQYLFCNARGSENDWELEIIRPQGSAMLGMACQANALAVARIGIDQVCPGDRLPFRWIK
ncbi:MAG: hypothetical protein A2901_00785 [Elusimicrobia bacterium RIFCSPLOWO2_01_FULL_54_10]|nr:MAG: hypothetical protein A2901_00785 [Elusimicrobia bacterium RIFCSPLOWO2_01_FULL_54_10]